MDIRYVTGDATHSPRDQPGVILHVCNDIGAWGKGFVVAVSRRWKEPEQSFRAWSREKESLPYQLGQVQFVQVEENRWVANLIGQHGIRGEGLTPPVRYKAIQQGLARVAEKACTLGASVHVPRIACGLAGGTWDRVEPILPVGVGGEGHSRDGL